MTTKSRRRITKDIPKRRTPGKNGKVWIDPVGGLGDTLMLSGVLKLALDRHPSKKYNLVRRTMYQSILKGHPAIDKIGFPPKGATIVGTDYWSLEKLGPNNQRPFQILARKFGLSTPVEEQLFFPERKEDCRILNQFIPWKEKRTIIIAPESDSPRKMVAPERWQMLVEKLKEAGNFVIQVGRMEDCRIRGAYSLLGLTTPGELISLVKRSRLVITVDNFIMHASHLAATPALVLWGPTDSCVYGYPEQVHLSADKGHCQWKSECLGPGFPQNYPMMCPLKENQCMNNISLDNIFEGVLDIFGRREK